MASSPKAELRTAGREGFTLLELLVVMAILAGLVAIALPQFGQLLARIRASFELSDIEQQILQLPQVVRASGHGGVLVDPKETALPANPDTSTAERALGRSERLRIELPAGWTMRVPTPLFYNFTGACSGGEVDLALPPARYRYILTAPLCRPQLAQANAQ